MTNGTKPKLQPSKDAGRRRTLLDHLKQNGETEASDLAGILGVTAMAARQHLYILKEEGLVTFREVVRGRGRPAKQWYLTPAADRFFPDGYADLTLSLIRTVEATFGAAGLNKLIAQRTLEQIESYREQLNSAVDLDAKVHMLAKIRNDEGYMAECKPRADGSYELFENHCPICAAATYCSGLCASELELFQAALGPNVRVNRQDHILSGARRCAYLITPE